MRKFFLVLFLFSQICYASNYWGPLGSSGGGTWGSITGTLSAQTDLNTALLQSKGVTIDSPGASENVPLFYTTRAVTISKQMCVLPGGSATPSVTYKINWGSDVTSGTGVVTAGSTCTSVTTGNQVTSFNAATISAGSFVWLTTSAQSGTVPMMGVTVEYQ